MIKPITRPELTDFLRGYAEAALWTSTDESREDGEDGGDPLDAKYSVDDISDGTLARMAADCERFQADNAADLAEYATLMSDRLRMSDGSPDEHAGHDFWLTRNGHGCGYWDRDIGAVGERLTEACKQFGEVYLMVEGDEVSDGMLDGPPSKLRVSVSYSALTEESVSDGDHSDNGWIDDTSHDRHSLTGDNRDCVLDQSRGGAYDWHSLREAIAFMADKCGHVDTCWHPADHTGRMTLSGTGCTEDCEDDEIEVCYDMHVSGVSDGTMMRLARLLKTNGVYFANAFR